MFKHIKTLIIGLVIFCVIFTFMPTGSSGNQVVSGFKQMSVGATATNQGALVSDYTIAMSSEAANTLQEHKADGTFPEPEAGKASGLWGTTHEMYDLAMSSGGGRGITESQLKNGWDYVGTAPDVEWTYNDRPSGTTDSFAGDDGIGFVRYPQGSGYGGWNALISGSKTFGDNACGLINTASALSSLSKQWVHPMELLVVFANLDNYPDKKSTSGFSGAFPHDALADCCRWAGFDQTTCAQWGEPWSQESVDKCLDAGGVVIAVFKKIPLCNEGPGKAHYVCIRQSIDCPVCGGSGGKCYLVSNSVVSFEDRYPTDKSMMPTFGHYTWELLNYAVSSHRQEIYIYPHNEKLGIADGGGTP